MKYFTHIAVATVLLTIGCDRRGEYPYPSADSIPALVDVADWRYVESLGSSTGPFKALGDHVLNDGARKGVCYSLAGERVEKDLDLPGEVLIRRFENPDGDSRLMVYERR